MTAPNAADNRPDAANVRIAVTITFVALIGALAAVLYTVFFQNNPSARNARCKSELKIMTQAIEAYRAYAGEYPPDGTEPDEVKRFLHKLFPKAQDIELPKLDPSTAPMYWLAGPKGTGFSADPVHPFAEGGRRIGPFYAYTKSRVKEMHYVPFYSTPEKGSPYLYFKPVDGKYDLAKSIYHATDQVTGQKFIVRPFMSGDGWVAPDAYQLLAPGNSPSYGSLDIKTNLVQQTTDGQPPQYPGGANYEAAVRSYIANFTRLVTVGDDMPKH